AGRPRVGTQSGFRGYVALVAASQALGLGVRAVIGLQVLCAALASIALYGMAWELGGSIAGIVAASLFTFNPEIIRWHSFVLTDSLYISLVILSVWAVHAAAERGGGWYLSASISTLSAAAIRPEGRLLVPVAAFGVILSACSTRQRKWIASACATVILLGAAQFVGIGRPAAADEGAVWLPSVQQGIVIWGDPASRLPMPAATHAIVGAEPVWRETFDYGVQHPWATLKLAGARVGTELLHARRFYSRIHNLTVVAILLPTYVLALLGFARSWPQPLARLLVAVIGLHLLIVAATFANWDGRFLLYILPLIDVFAAVGLSSRFSSRPALSPRPSAG
ncbi:MAG: glycosyltransferase family 39 protein, partial [Acidobacteria bacterium]|nr:glycosyltransferase family 39 protein [Acidobacteriota bacterium]